MLQGPHLQRRHHRHAPARRHRASTSCAGSRTSSAAREGDRHHRLRLGRERGRGAQGRRLRLPHQAGRPASSSAASSPRRSAAAAGRADGRPGDAAVRAPRRADAARAARRRRRRAPAPASAGARAHGRPVDGDAAGARADREGRAQHGAGAGQRRIGHRQGARRARDPRRAARAARSRSSPVNCGAIPENLLEAEFFGYRKGAFTGANDDRDGFFQAAQRRHAVPRRDRRPAAVDAGQAAARDPGALGAPGRRGRRRRRSTCASSAPPTRTSAPRCRPAASARTCTTAST